IDGGLKIEDGALGADHERSSILDLPSSIQGELRAYLKDRLPDYMVPASFVVLPQLPLNVNGKIDRRMLPAPDAVRQERASSIHAPRTHTEEMLAGIWGAGLDLPQVDTHANFFDLGGHSLLATQVMVSV